MSLQQHWNTWHYPYYHLLFNRNPITNFANADTAVTGELKQQLQQAPLQQQPAALGTAPVITHGLSDGGSNDIDENGTPENYSITIDCNQNSH